jgi:hypothetical protein
VGVFGGLGVRVGLGIGLCQQTAPSAGSAGQGTNVGVGRRVGTGEGVIVGHSSASMVESWSIVAVGLGPEVAVEPLDGDGSVAREPIGGAAVPNAATVSARAIRPRTR